MPTRSGRASSSWACRASASPRNMAGSASSPLELCVVAEEIGRAAAPVPFDSSVVLATEALKLAGSEAQKKKWLPQLARGEAIGTLAVAEGPQPPKPRNVTHDVRRRQAERQEGAGGRRRGGDLRHRAGQDRRVGDRACRWLVDLSQAGVDEEARRDHRSGAQACRAHLQRRGGRAAGRRGRGLAPARAAVRRGGGATWPSSRSAAPRRRCGWRATMRCSATPSAAPIGSYQAIKHKLADCYVKHELARSNAYYGAMVLTERRRRPADRGRGGADRRHRGLLFRLQGEHPDPWRHRLHLGGRHAVPLPPLAPAGAVDRRAAGLEGQAGDRLEQKNAA